MASGPWARGWSTEQSGRAGLSCADESASGHHGEEDGSDPWGRRVREEAPTGKEGAGVHGSRHWAVRVKRSERERAARELGRMLVAGPETQRRKRAGAEERADWA